MALATASRTRHQDPVPGLLRDVAALEKPAAKVLHHFDVLETAGKRHPDRAGFGGRSRRVHSRASKARRILSKSRRRKEPNAACYPRPCSGNACSARPELRSWRPRPPVSPTSCPTGWPRSPGASRRSGGASSPVPSRPRSSTKAEARRILREKIVEGLPVPPEEAFARTRPSGSSRTRPKMLDTLLDFYAGPGRGLLRPCAPAVLRRRGRRGARRRRLRRGREQPHLSRTSSPTPCRTRTCGWPIASRLSAKTPIAGSRSRAFSRGRPRS